MQNTLKNNARQVINPVKDRDRGIMKEYGLKTRKALRKFIKKQKSVKESPNTERVKA